MAALVLALAPFRSTLGLPGALLFLLLGVVTVTIVGGVPPAIAAVVIGFALGEFFFTHPYDSFRMSVSTEIVAMVLFVAVAALVSVLVDRLARRGLQVTRLKAESEALARLAGGSVLSGIEPLPDLVADLRRTFDLESVAVLAAASKSWSPIAVAGGTPPGRPEDGTFSAPIAENTVLVLTGSMLDADDSRLLQAFVAQLRLAEERAQLESRAASAAELAEANSLRTALLAAVSHDLRTPLATIKAAATSLVSREVAWSSDEINDFAKTIDAEADRLTHLVSNLLDMSRLQTGALKVASRPVSVDEVLYTTVGTLGRVVRA